MDLSMSTGQAAYDNQAEPEFEDDGLTDEVAAEIAQGELDATPAVVSEWLHNECCADVDVLDLRNFAGYNYSECPPAVILAALMTCERERMQSWVYALREAFGMHCDAGGMCKERAGELMRADERERQREADISRDESMRHVVFCG